MMMLATLATDMDGWGDFELVSTPGSLNWKHGIGRVSHAGLGRTSMSTLDPWVESKWPLNSVLAIPRLMPSPGQKDPPMVSAQSILPPTPT